MDSSLYDELVAELHKVAQQTGIKLQVGGPREGRPVPLVTTDPDDDTPTMIGQLADTILGPGSSWQWGNRDSVRLVLTDGPRIWRPRPEFTHDALFVVYSFETYLPDGVPDEPR